jgi:hypothetical protein
MEIVSALGAASFFVATYFLSEGRIFKKIIMGIVVVAFFAGLPFVAISAYNMLQYMMDAPMNVELFQFSFTAALIALVTIIGGLYLLRKD